MRTSLVTVAWTAALLLFGAAGHAQQLASTGQQWRPLSGQEIKSLVLAHKIGAINRYGHPSLAVYSPDGTLTAQAHPAKPGVTASAVVTDSGQWRLVGDQLCIKMQEWMDRTEQCASWRTNGAMYERVGMAQYTQPPIYFDQVVWSGGVWRWQNIGGD